MRAGLVDFGGVVAGVDDGVGLTHCVAGGGK